MTDIPPRPEVDRFKAELHAGGLHAALANLNGRTPYRFTGVYRFDGDMLRNVQLFDRWHPGEAQGADAPMRETFCALVKQVGDVLAVTDGRSDERFPWMMDNAVVCYCGALIRDDEGEAYGTLCHFDLQRCEPPGSELSVLRAAAPFVYAHLTAG
jgi:hypothetical protein